MKIDRAWPVTWYCCGPTVYSHSHLGHARCYIVFDAMRRLLEHRFGLQVHFAMNITDIDDKIIAAASAAGTDFAEFASRWEADFFKLMGQLNVQLPDSVLRVSDYMPEIQAYIAQIEDNGYAYSANGDVYFDVEKFRKAGFDYCQLVPSAFQDPTLRPSDEVADQTGKKNIADFALWKKSKAAEPFWKSKWGNGRPGWHIECSALIKEIVPEGRKLTIHSGGSDLKFPHHDNEIAQGEAHSCQKGWVDYFIHCAPLVIKGLKMSKSLKNYITIDEALQQVSGRQLRLYVLLHKYSIAMNFDPEGSFKIAKEKDKYLEEFFANLSEDINKQTSALGTRLKGDEKAFDDWLTSASAEVNRSLANNFDTSTALAVIFKAAKKYNIFKTTGSTPSITVLRRLTRLTQGLMNNLGLDYYKTPSGACLPSTQESLGLLVAFRKQVLDSLRSGDVQATFQVCDRLRDVVLPQLGVKVEDGKDGYRIVQPSVQAKDSQPAEKEKPTIDLNVSKKQAREEKKTTSTKIKDRRKAGEGLFAGQRYEKFKIGQIDEEGIPKTDTHGNQFPPKLVERFKRDLERYLQTDSSNES